MRARGVVASVVLVVVGVSGACSGSDGAGEGDVVSIHGAPVLAGTTSPPGTKLPDGFEVARGSVLLGPVIPADTVFVRDGIRIPDHGWSATFLVTGDPLAVVDRYRAQAARAGSSMLTDLLSCSRRVPSGVECAMSDGAPPTGDERWPPRIRLDLGRGPGGKGFPPASHLLVHFSDAGGSRDPASGVPTVEADRRPPGFPDEWPRLLGAGDRVPEKLAITATGIVIEHETRAVAPLAPSRGCNGGFVGIFEVTGDVDAVVAGYARQFAAAGFEPLPGATPIAAHSENGTTVTDVHFDASGGGDIRALAVERPGKRAYLELSRCND